MKDSVKETLTNKGYLGDFSLPSVEWWLRIQKHLHCEIFFSMFHKKWSVNNYIINLKKLKKIEIDGKIPQYEDYSDALEFAIEQMTLKL